jgi:hypothetical protein
MIPTDEEAMIARHTIETIGHGSDVEGETAL